VGDWWVEKWLVGRDIVCVMVADMFGGRKGERKGWTGWGRRVGKEGCVSTFLQWHEIIVCGGNDLTRGFSKRNQTQSPPYVMGNCCNPGSKAHSQAYIRPNPQDQVSRPVMSAINE